MGARNPDVARRGIVYECSRCLVNWGKGGILITPNISMFRVCGAACTVVALRDHTPMSLRRGVHCAWCAMSLFCCGGVLFGVLYVQAEGYWQRGAAYKGFAPGVTSFADVDIEKLQSVQEQPVYASLSDP